MSEQVNNKVSTLTEAKMSELARAMDKLVGEHPEAQSVDEWFLIITLYASGLTGIENNFCKQCLVRKYQEKDKLRSELRPRQWVREAKCSLKEGSVERETVFKSRVVGVNLPRARGVAVENPDFVVVSIEGKAEYAVDVRLSVPIGSAKDFFAGQPVEVVLRLKDTD